MAVLVCPSRVALQSWDVYFSQVAKGAPPGTAYQAPPTLSPTPPAGTLVSPAAREEISKEISDHLLVNSLIRSYQVSVGGLVGGDEGGTVGAGGWGGGCGFPLPHPLLLLRFERTMRPSRIL